ncbi:uncharacterized protein SPSK_01298 [Sporothrix schenckii 1099-18]|uniref:Uncharacterized protein n=1 Tax=Sporothrix schenckii 1099-18 TaxID=1397361 RepID=A0A0F2LZP9_SPOSC|nr:uncharacterized protein SPSK_01298 [Sporothrix schenckii 1099-18]KJR81391.1 hypothetical protein SPSK_01298 [Sporothrix schenckii 1099-18]
MAGESDESNDISVRGEEGIDGECWRREGEGESRSLAGWESERLEEEGLGGWTERATARIHQSDTQRRQRQTDAEATAVDDYQRFGPLWAAVDALKDVQWAFRPCRREATKVEAMAAGFSTKRWAQM